MQLRKRKKKPVASAKPCGEVKLNQQPNKVAEFIRTFGANEYKWLRISVQLKTAI